MNALLPGTFSCGVRALALGVKQIIDWKCASVVGLLTKSCCVTQRNTQTCTKAVKRVSSCLMLTMLTSCQALCSCCHLLKERLCLRRPCQFRVAVKEPLKVVAIAVRQLNGDVKEKLIMRKLEAADKLANAAIYGIVALKPNVMFARDLDTLLSHKSQEDVPQVLHDPPTCKAKHSKSSGSRSSGHRTPPKKDQHDTKPGQSDDLLALLVPTADPDTRIDSKHSPNLTAEQLQILEEVTSAAQCVLQSSPDIVLSSFLKRLLQQGNEPLALIMSPYLLAMCSGSQQELQRILAAIDIEKFSSCKGRRETPTVSQPCSRRQHEPCHSCGRDRVCHTASLKSLEGARNIAKKAGEALERPASSLGQTPTPRASTSTGQ